MLFLHGHTEDLKSCCLASRVLCTAAQSQLFHTIVILPSPKTTTVWINNAAFLRTSELATCRRLADICAESPHLGQNIRRLELLWYAEVFKEIFAMRLVCARELEFFPRKGFMDPKRLDERTLKSARRLVCLPTIERVEVRFMRQPAAFYSRLFDFTSPRLREICFDSCELYSGEQQQKNATAIAPTARRVITYLRLYDSTALSPWLLGAACPFDWTHLTHADVSASLNADIASILRGASLTLRELSLTLAAYPLHSQSTSPTVPRSRSSPRSRTSPSRPARSTASSLSSRCWRPSTAPTASAR